MFWNKKDKEHLTSVEFTFFKQEIEKLQIEYTKLKTRLEAVELENELMLSKVTAKLRYDRKKREEETPTEEEKPKDINKSFIKLPF